MALSGTPDGSPESETDDSALLATLGAELRSVATTAKGLEEYHRNYGIEDNTKVAHLLEVWFTGDKLARNISRLIPCSLHDLEVKSAAFLWLDGGLLRDEEEPSTKLVYDVMNALAGGISGLTGSALPIETSGGSTTAPVLDANAQIGGREIQLSTWRV